MNTLRTAWALLLWPAALIAQDQPAVPVEIRVVDGSGGAILRATVTLNRDGRTHTAGPDASGIYRIAAAPGEYALRVSADGFRTLERPVSVRAGGPSRLTALLEIHVTARIEVAARSSGLSPTLGSALTLSGQALRELPRESGQLLRTLENMAGTRGRPGDVALYVNGFSTSRRLPPTEAIELIRINANPFATEFAEPGSRRIEIITKAGAEQSYGQVGVSWNGRALNARPALSPTPDSAETLSLTGAVGFPIIPGRWGLTLYAGGWHVNDRAVVHAMTLDPSFQPQAFSQTVGTPVRTGSVAVQTASRLRTTTLSAEYAHVRESASNQGLLSGLNLPERAYSHGVREDAVRLMTLSILGPRVVHEVRVQAVRRSDESRAVNDAPAVMVLDAFSAGGNQEALLVDHRDDRLELTSALTIGSASNVLKAGFGAGAVRLSETNRANFGGTFTFGAGVERDAAGAVAHDASGEPVLIAPLEQYRRALAGLAGYRPTFFSIAEGRPDAAVTQSEYHWFVQDEWRPSEHVALSLGVRHDFQSHLASGRNFAPRAHVSWTAGPTGTFRAGAGVFYSIVAPRITLDTIRLDGERQLWLLVQDPAFFPNVPQDSSGATAQSTIVRTKSARLAMPYRVVSSLAYERQLSASMRGAIAYGWTRGARLLRTRDVNAATPDRGAVRPRADQGPILQVESTGRSTRHELSMSLLADLRQSLRLNANYTLASSRADTDGPFTTAANPDDLAGEYGRAVDDHRHQAYVEATIRLPFAFSVTPSIAVHSGGAFNILTGTDGGGNGLFVSRPAFARPGDPGAIVTPFGAFDPGPQPGTAVVPRNYGSEPGQFQANVSVFKTVPLGHSIERRYVMLGVNAENVINHANLDSVMGILTSPNFGKPNHALPARRVTLVLQVGF